MQRAIEHYHNAKSQGLEQEGYEWNIPERYENDSHMDYAYMGRIGEILERNDLPYKAMGITSL